MPCSCQQETSKTTATCDWHRWPRSSTQQQLRSREPRQRPEDLHYQSLSRRGMCVCLMSACCPNCVCAMCGRHVCNQRAMCERCVCVCVRCVWSFLCKHRGDLLRLAYEQNGALCLRMFGPDLPDRNLHQAPLVLNSASSAGVTAGREGAGRHSANSVYSAAAVVHSRIQRDIMTHLIDAGMDTVICAARLLLKSRSCSAVCVR